LLSIAALSREFGIQPADLSRIAAVLGLRARHHAVFSDNPARFANPFEVPLVDFGFPA
jgi:hypothetical protein